MRNSLDFASCAPCEFPLPKRCRNVGQAAWKGIESSCCRDETLHLTSTIVKTPMQNLSSSNVSRRNFIRNSSLVAASAAAVVNFPSILHAEGKQAINAVIIGIGGRGGGAGANFLD